MGDALPTVDLGAGRTATAISAGRAHTCAILDDRSLKCWGLASMTGQPLDIDNPFIGDEPGEMGDALPPLSFGEHGVSLVAAGYFQSCAILDDGTASCWGEGVQAPTLVPLMSTSPVRALTKGSRGALALFEDGTVQDLAASGTPPSFLSSGDRAVAAGGAWEQKECAVLTTGGLRCAYPLDGYIFNVSNVFSAPPPGTPRLSAISFEEEGGESPCGLLDDGTVRCISYGSDCTPAWCDDSTTTIDHTIAVKLGQPAVALTTGGYTHTCALLENGGVRCWGDQTLTASYAPLGAAFPPILIDSETYPHETFHDVDLGSQP